MNGKRSANEAAPGGLVGLLVGIVLAYLAKRHDLDLPEGASDAIVGGLAAIGGILSSYHLGNRRVPTAPELPHQGPGTSDSLNEIAAPDAKEAGK